ncbi:TonB-dependent receptor domain-containing protein [Psittacicella gerlachiana]|nr:TonB-dependent receptor [Psittacicella gerlachiana]
MKRNFSLTLVASVMLAVAGQAFADSSSESTKLQTVTVTGTQPATVLTVTPTTSSTGTLKSFFGNDLTVSITKSQRQRDGEASINIRGLQGNRIALTLDGISLGEGLESRFWSAKIKAISFGRGAFIETTGLKSATIDFDGNNRGSLGPSVNFQTLDPADILNGRVLGGYVYTKYDSTDSSFTNSAAYAWHFGAYQGYVLGTYRTGHEVKNNASELGSSTGSSRLKPNPQDTSRYYFLTKHFYQLNEANKVGFTLEYLRDRTYTDWLTAVGFNTVRGSTSYTSYEFTNDRNTRARVSLSHEYSTENLLVNTQLSYADQRNKSYRQYANSSDTTLSSSSTFTETNSLGKYSFKTLSLVSDAAQRLPFAGLDNTLRYGLNFSQDRTSFGYVTTSGSTVTSMRPIPNSTATNLSLYVSDELLVAGFTIKPTLTLAHYRLEPKTTNGYVQGYTTASGNAYGTLNKINKTKVLPKLYLDYKVAEAFVPYFQYSHGFRAPSVQQLYGYFNRGARGGSQSYIIGNPSLKPETSRNFELGFKGQTPDFSYQVSGFVIKYKNFISRRIDRATTDGIMYFSYANQKNAKIYGFTADAKLKLYNNYYVFGAIAYAKGNQTDDLGVYSAMNSTDPLKTRLGASYETQTWGAKVTWNWTDKRKTKDLNVGANMYNPSSAYSKVDVDLYWKPIKGLTLGFGISNLFDAKYVDWSNISYYYTNFFEQNGVVSGITAANADSFTEPGRTFYVTLRYDF